MPDAMRAQADEANFANLTKMWLAMGADPLSRDGSVPGLVSRSWPHRVWFPRGTEAPPEALDAVVRHERAPGLVIHLWGENPAALDRALAERGFEVGFVQTAMMLDLREGAVPPAPEGEIRDVTDAEAAAVWTAVAASAFGYAIDVAVVDRIRRHPDAVLVVCRREDPSGFAEVAGTGLLFLDGDTAGLHMMGVAPAFRRRGIARDVLAHLVRRAHDRGCRRVALQASAMGRPLYESVGFVGETPIRNYRLRA